MLRFWAIRKVKSIPGRPQQKSRWRFHEGQFHENMGCGATNGAPGAGVPFFPAGEKLFDRGMPADYL
jgi:hypothetical protein